MEYQFEIAGKILSVEFPAAVEMEEAYLRFLTRGKKPDIVIHIQLWEMKPDLQKGRRLYRGGYDVYEIEKKEGYVVEQSHEETGIPYFQMILKKTEASVYFAYVKEEALWRYQFISEVFRAIDLEHLLNRKRVFFLHASFIEWKGEGILFTAPSGTGKSTQAKLWMDYEKAKIINGDRAAVANQAGEWRAYGLPYAGSSRIFLNRSSRIGAIIVLRQEKENRLERLKPSEAFRWIYSEATVQYWDYTYQDILTAMLMELVMAVPVYRLSCLPEQSAVEILKKELEQKNGSNIF